MLCLVLIYRTVYNRLYSSVWNLLLRCEFAILSWMPRILKMFLYSRKARLNSDSISWLQIPVFTVKPRAASGISLITFPIEVQSSRQSNIYRELPLKCLASLMHLSSFPCHGPSDLATAAILNCGLCFFSSLWTLCRSLYQSQDIFTR